MSRNVLFVLLLATGVALADEPAGDKPVKGAAEADAKKEAEAKAKEEDAKAKEAADAKAKDEANLGMSILGNQEAPKSLVIVPWKSSEIGKGLGISTMLDDSRQPIDKEVFMRVLSYYDLRSTTTHRRKQ